MKKTIQQIVNESIAGMKIATRKNKIGIIKKVIINAPGGNHLGSIELEIEGKVTKEIIYSHWSELHFTDFVEQQVIKLDMHLSDVIGLSVLCYNVLRKNNFKYVKDIYAYKQSNGDFRKIINLGEKMNNELNDLIIRVVVN